MAYREIILADRPANYWRLNEPSGTSAVDLVAGANGTISGGVTLNQPGALADGDKAMAFNGTDGKIQTVASVAIPLVCTIELWVKILSGNAGRVMIDSRSIGAGNTVVLYITDATGTVTIASAVGTVTTTRGVTDGAWHHLVCVLTGTTGRWYLDGTPDLPVVLVRSTPGTGPISFACDQVTAGEWPGSLDEVAIYPYALTTEQILAHYQARALPFLPGTYPYAVVQDGASNFWRLNEPSGTTAVDLVGGANGTISGGVTLNQPGALSDGDKAMTFNGTTGQVVTAATMPVVVTVEGWIKTTATGSQRPMLANYDGTVGGLYFGIGTTNQAFVYTTAAVVGVKVVTDGQWHHIVAVFTGGSITIYLDGQLEISGGNPRTASGPPVNIASSSLAQFWSGSIDDVAIYPVALTPAQIAAHYTARLWAPTIAAPVVIEDGEDDDDEAALRLRDFYGSISGSVRVLPTDSGLIPLVPAVAKHSHFVQRIHVEVTTLGAGIGWTFQDGAGVPLVPGVSAAALAHLDFNFGVNGVPCTEATAFVLSVTGGSGASGWVSWEGYRLLTGALTLGPFTPRYSDLVRADGASNYWRLNETSGLTAVDGIGGKTGTISGGVTLNQPGALADGDKAMTFNGTTGKISTVANVTTPATVTIEAWLKLAASTGAFPVVFTNRPTGPGDPNEIYAGLLPNGRLTLRTGVASVDGIRLVTDNQWHHVVYLSNAGTAQLYVDGVLDTSGALSRSVLASPGYIGADGGNGFAWWPGSLDDVAIYPVALTPAQIAAHYAVGLGRAVPV